MKCTAYTAAADRHRIRKDHPMFGYEEMAKTVTGACAITWPGSVNSKGHAR